MEKLTTWLWFDTEAEEAAQFYTSVFPDSRITDVSHYGEAGPRAAGTVMTVSFELLGRTFVGLNGGPEYKIGGVGDLVHGHVRVAGRAGRVLGQARGGRRGDRLRLGHRPLRRHLADRPDASAGAFGRPGSRQGQAGMHAMLKMKKIEIAELERAAAPRRSHTAQPESLLNTSPTDLRADDTAGRDVPGELGAAVDALRRGGAARAATERPVNAVSTSPRRRRTHCHRRPSRATAAWERAGASARRDPAARARSTSWCAPTRLIRPGTSGSPSLNAR